MIRKKYFIFFAALACYGQENGGEKPVSVSFESTFVSQYLWRGYVLNSSPSFQPAVNLAIRGVSASVWANCSRTAPHNQACTETDVALEYTRKLGWLSLSAGFLDYRYPDIADSAENRTEEVSFGAAADVWLHPSVKVYHDVRLGNGNYYYLGVQKDVLLPHVRKSVLNLAGGVGLNQHLYQGQTTVSDAGLTATLSIPAGRLVVSPFVNATVGHRSLFGSHAAFGVKLSTGL